MTHFVQLNKLIASITPTNFGRVVAVFDTTKSSSSFPDIKAFLVADETGLAQPGMYYNGTTFGNVPVTLNEAKALKQTQLDGFFNAHFDLAMFIREGSVTTITGTQVGTFLATITNNYRILRASIVAAVTISAVVAIDVTTGWPNNP